MREAQLPRVKNSCLLQHLSTLEFVSRPRALFLSLPSFSPTSLPLSTMPLFNCFWPIGRAQVPKERSQDSKSKRSPKVLQKPRPSSDLDQQAPRSTKTQQVPRDPIQERARLEAEFDQLSRLVPIENLLTKFRELMNEIRSTGRQSMIPEDKCENWTRKVDEKLKRLTSQDVQFYYLRIVALRNSNEPVSLAPINQPTLSTHLIASLPDLYRRKEWSFVRSEISTSFSFPSE